MIQHIIFATDGSAPAKRAGDFTASLATRYGARVTVMHAFAPMPTFLGEPYHSQMVNKVLGEAETLIEDAAKRLREKGVTDVDTDVLEGSAAATILRVVEIREPDLLIVGRRGLSTWKGLILGSVSMAVTQRAKCPVLVVK
jgi:nucleotide-binding universal stress UspA family protein